MPDASQYTPLPPLPLEDVREVKKIAGANGNLFQGFCAERQFALWLEGNGFPGSYQNCVAQQMGGAWSRTDLLSIDLKSTDGNKYCKSLEETTSLNLQVKFDTLSNERIANYGCVVFFKNNAYFAGWAPREELLANGLPGKKIDGLRLPVSNLRPLSDYLEKVRSE